MDRSRSSCCSPRNAERPHLGMWAFLPPRISRRMLIGIQLFHQVRSVTKIRGALMSSGILAALVWLHERVFDELPVCWRAHRDLPSRRVLRGPRHTTAGPGRAASSQWRLRRSRTAAWCARSPCGHGLASSCCAGGSTRQPPVACSRPPSALCRCITGRTQLAAPDVGGVIVACGCRCAVVVCALCGGRGACGGGWRGHSPRE